ncbi:hypothetical protein GH714_015727 [Hevea brasiliensis]|uniref:RING-type E3 ubiquitin transferase n=1 Tax=Hevea brasiliensis TaxID=3981 RepID=A0A6A6L062_HEVBR|nr:hypothetical protein GH714_015727 [Hevea brasiliensis]
MGKKQHSKDRMFITKTEWATEWGGAKTKEVTRFKRLPFYCCALTFTPYEYPVCTADGSVFDIMNITPYIRKYGKHPVTGAPLKLEDLIPLTFHKNSEGEYHCPVLNKVFTEFTHIVAVKTTGNVFCYEAIKELNIKTKNWKELLTDEPFTKEDLITIQNPNALDSKVTLDFDHVKNGLKVDDEELKKMSSDAMYNINATGDMKQMLEELGTEKAKQTALHGGGGSKAQNERAAALAAILAARSRIKEDSKSDSNGESKPRQAYSIVDAASAAVHGRSAAAAKAASGDKTAARIAMHMAGERAPVNAKMVKSRYTTGAASRSFTSTSFDPVTKNDFEYIKVEKNPKKKGYVQLHTTHGDLNIELHCDITPRTCENFITLCEQGYYNGVAFHRSIRNFMIQGGDPTVFGGVVGGLTTLAAMEKVPVDDNDRPLEEIKIISVTVFVNPYMEPDEEDEQEEAKDEKPPEDEENEKVGSWYSNPGTGTTESRTVGSGGGIGKYLKARNSQPESVTMDSGLSTIAVAKKRKVGVSTGEFKDFSAW